MYYIKCSHCGSLNEAKSEFQVFCTSCDKKLDNTFGIWHRRNPDKNFEDYKQIFCVKESEIEEQPVKRKSRSGGSSLKYYIAMVFVAAIFFILGTIYGNKIVNFIGLNINKISNKSVFETKWETRICGNLGLTIDFPVELNKTKMELPELMQKVVKDIYTYEYISASGFKLYVTSISYIKVNRDFDLKAAANGTISELKVEHGVTDFTFGEDTITLNKIPGYKQQGSYKLYGADFRFLNSGFAKNSVYWYVYVTYPESDEIEKKAAERVIKSIKIKVEK